MTGEEQPQDDEVVVPFKNLDTGEMTMLPISKMDSAVERLLAMFNTDSPSALISSKPIETTKSSRWSSSSSTLRRFFARRQTAPLPRIPPLVRPSGDDDDFSDDYSEDESSAPTEEAQISSQRPKATLFLFRRRSLGDSHSFSTESSVPYNIPVNTVKEECVWSNLWCVGEMSTNEGSPIWAMAYTSNLIACGSQDGLISIWTLCNNSPTIFTRERQLVLNGHTSSIVACVFEGDSIGVGLCRLASSALDHTVRVWTISIGNPSEVDCCLGVSLCGKPLVIHTGDWVTSLTFHPKQEGLLYTATIDGTLQLWKIAESSGRKFELVNFRRLASHVTCVSISPDTSLIAVGFTQGVLALYDASTLNFRAHVECRNRQGRMRNGRKVTGAVWTSDSKFICVSTSDSRIRLLSLANLPEWVKFKGHVCNAIMLYASFLPGEKHVVAGSENNSIYLWERGQIIKTSELKSNKIPTNNQFEKFKAFDVLLTYTLVPNRQFCQNALKCLTTSSSYSKMDVRGGRHSRPSQYEQLGEFGEVGQPGHHPEQPGQPVQPGQPGQPGQTSAPSDQTAYGSFILAASYTGIIKVFVNLGHKKTKRTIS